MKKFLLLLLVFVNLSLYADDTYDFMYNDYMYKSSDNISGGRTLREKADIDLEEAIRKLQERNFNRMLANAYKIEIDTFGGSVYIVTDEKAKQISIETSNWNLLSIPTSENTLEIDSGDQDVKLVLPASMHYQNIEVDTLSGDIYIDGVTCFDYRITNRDGKVEMNCKNIPEKIDIETGFGDISVKVPADREVSVLAVSDSGSVDSDFPYRKARYRRYNIESRKGNISVKKS